MVRKKGFNLLKNQVEPQTVWTKLYNWTTSTARALMVIVELVIVVSFGVRVVVDLQFKNLNKDIALKEGVLVILQDTEMRLRLIQNKADTYYKLWNEAGYNGDIFATATEYIPDSVNELSVNLENDQLIVTGFADTQVVADIEAKFKSSPHFTRTELINVETQGGQDSFTLRTQLKDPPVRKNITF